MSVHIATLTRAYQTVDVTLGILQIRDVDHRPVYMLENPWLDNTPYVSSVPKDSYVADPYRSNKFGACWQLRDVPGRSAILIHAGNFETDTSGCLLPGMAAGELGGKVAVLQSQQAMAYLRQLLGVESFILTIR